jgi:2-C-methyl-D-erythritol 4-phosphate cytidylyltransferase
MPIAAIIVASGESRRMGFDKLTADLNGKPVLYHAVAAFCRCASIDEIYVVCPDERFDCLTELLPLKKIHQVQGGRDRQHSVLNGLNALNSETTLVAVHDGARPMIDIATIEKCILAARQYGAATVARRVTETVKRADTEGFARSGVDRANLWFMETPQCFRVNVLKRGYKNVNERGAIVTDEVSVVESLGVSSFIVESGKPNIKITVPSDLKLASLLMADSL